MAALLSFIVGSITVGVAVVLIIVLNAAVAFVQERHAENAVEALAGYIPQKLTVVRDGTRKVIDTAELVPGDIALVQEGDRIAADLRLISGAVEVDLSTLTGESVPAMRSEYDRPRAGGARAFVQRQHVHGRGRAGGRVRDRVAHRAGADRGALAGGQGGAQPLDQQVRSVSRLIARVAVALAVAFVPLAIFVTGLSVKSSVTFAVGLLAGMVPEGLLPVITLSLAVAVTLLARRGAVVKRSSSVETLGSTDVICTDKTGTLTENRMHPVVVCTCAGEIRLDAEGRPQAEPAQPPLSALLETAAACSNARLDGGEEPSGDPTEIAVLQAARALGGDVDADRRERSRRHEYNFDAHVKLMSTLDAERWLRPAAHQGRAGVRAACVHHGSRPLRQRGRGGDDRAATRSPGASRTTPARDSACSRSRAGRCRPRARRRRATRPSRNCASSGS